MRPDVVPEATAETEVHQVRREERSVSTVTARTVPVGVPGQRPTTIAHHEAAALTTGLRQIIVLPGPLHQEVQVTEVRERERDKVTVRIAAPHHVADPLIEALAQGVAAMDLRVVRDTAEAVAAAVTEAREEALEAPGAIEVPVVDREVRAVRPVAREVRHAQVVVGAEADNSQKFPDAVLKFS